MKKLFVQLPAWIKLALFGGAGLLATVVVGVAVIYLWPLRNAQLQQGHGRTVSYQVAASEFSGIHDAEVGNGSIQPDCQSILLNHGQRTARAVVMFHGYHSCPGRFRTLAQVFYNAGYNVYVPRQPWHGLVHQADDAKVAAPELVQFTDAAITLGSGLGDEVGVVGLSAGGNLATWSAFYRPDVVKRALLLSPFYVPSASQTPKWQVKPFLVLYGFGILPDRFNDSGLSYHGLAQYVQIAQNYPAKAQANIPTAMVLAVGDHVIDKDRAREITRLLSPDVVIYVPPAEWGLAHDIVNDAGKDINGRAADLFPRYLKLYEGQPVN